MKEPWPRRVKQYVAKCLRLKSYLQSPSDGRTEFPRAGEGAAANPVVAEVAEEPLGQVEPRGATSADRPPGGHAGSSGLPILI